MKLSLKLLLLIVFIVLLFITSCITKRDPKQKDFYTGPPESVLVEKGMFLMGDTWGDGFGNERPTHRVEFTYDFYIGKYEVTFDEYDAFCFDTKRDFADHEDWGRGHRPVINVAWWDAVAYCNWLSDKEELPRAYNDLGKLLDEDGNVTTDPSEVVGYRLPTEAEWEFSARGGNDTQGYKYSGSNDPNEVAWYYENSQEKTQEVGLREPNELGIYDMSGNAYEWCSDYRVDYTSDARTNPYNGSGIYRVLRGGCWDSYAEYIRVAVRFGGTSAYSSSIIGFRIARTAP